MGGHPLLLVQHLQRALADAQLHLLAHQRVRHAVVVPVQLHVVVDADSRELELAHLHRRGWQRPESGAIELLEGGVPATRQLLEGPRIQLLQQHRDGPIELAQGREGPPPQPRQDPALHHLHAHLHLGLVLGVRRPRRQHRHAVVVAQLLQQAVAGGLIAIGPDHQRPGLVGHQQARHAADELQRCDDRAHPVHRLLRARGAGEGVVRRTQHGHKDLRAGDLPGKRVDHRDRLAGVVHEQAFAGLVHLAHRALQVPRPAGVFLAEGAVLVRLLAIGLAVFLPQQLQRHRGLLQLLVDLSPVGLEMARAARRRRRVHPCLQRLVIQLAGLLPRQAGGTRVAGDLTHAGLAQAGDASHLALAQLCLVKKLKNSSDLAHRDSRCGHRLGGSCSTEAGEPMPGCEVTRRSCSCPRSEWSSARHRLERCPRWPGLLPAIGWNAARHQRGIAPATRRNTHLERARCGARC
nr:transposase [uncultured bacterium]